MRRNGKQTYAKKAWRLAMAYMDARRAGMGRPPESNEEKIQLA